MHYPLFGQSGFCLILILSKIKGFQSERLLNMSPSPPMNGYGHDIYKKVGLKAKNSQ